MTCPLMVWGNAQLNLKQNYSFLEEPLKVPTKMLTGIYGFFKKNVALKDG